MLTLMVGPELVRGDVNGDETPQIADAVLTFG